MTIIFLFILNRTINNKTWLIKHSKILQIYFDFFFPKTDYEIDMFSTILFRSLFWNEKR